MSRYPSILSLFLHHLLIVALQARGHTVVLNFAVKLKLFKNASDKLRAAHSPAMVRRATFETETDVILVRPLANKTFNAGRNENRTGN